MNEYNTGWRCFGICVLFVGGGLLAVVMVITMVEGRRPKPVVAPAVQQDTVTLTGDKWECGNSHNRKVSVVTTSEGWLRETTGISEESIKIDKQICDQWQRKVSQTGATGFELDAIERAAREK